MPDAFICFVRIVSLALDDDGLEGVGAWSEGEAAVLGRSGDAAARDRSSFWA